MVRTAWVTVGWMVLVCGGGRGGGRFREELIMLLAEQIYYTFCQTPVLTIPLLWPVTTVVGEDNADTTRTG